jgi:hypothetical protein
LNSTLFSFELKFRRFLCISYFHPFWLCRKQIISNHSILQPPINKELQWCTTILWSVCVVWVLGMVLMVTAERHWDREAAEWVNYPKLKSHNHLSATGHKSHKTGAAQCSSLWLYWQISWFTHHFLLVIIVKYEEFLLCNSLS